MSITKRTVALLAFVAIIPSCHSRPSSLDARRYFPTQQAWQTSSPSAAGFDSVALDSAIAFARGHQVAWSKDMAAQVVKNNAREPYPDAIGPVLDRGDQNGVIIRHGYIVAEWGDTRKLDMTFSVAKSYLSTVAGLAVDDGLIRDVRDPVRSYVHDGGFDSEHNAPITWHMLLTQTSEWEGTLWDKPDMADRRAGRDRTLNAPGSFWEYNDVRVNRTALALLRVWKRPLPDVLKERIMDPIGASTWEWHGYRNSTVDVDGRKIESVSGGGHWGGGVWASTRDHARFGLLALNHGRWGDRQLVSERWFAMATTPTDIKPVYGYFWWLNTDSKQFPSAGPRSFFALGNGGNTIWMDSEHDMVVVTRWLDSRSNDEFMRLVRRAVKKG